MGVSNQNPCNERDMDGLSPCHGGQACVAQLPLELCRLALQLLVGSTMPDWSKGTCRVQAKNNLPTPADSRLGMELFTPSHKSQLTMAMPCLLVREKEIMIMMISFRDSLLASLLDGVRASGNRDVCVKMKPTNRGLFTSSFHLIQGIQSGMQ